jgi:hypothetical protein
VSINILCKKEKSKGVTHHHKHYTNPETRIGNQPYSHLHISQQADQYEHAAFWSMVAKVHVLRLSASSLEQISNLHNQNINITN